MKLEDKPIYFRSPRSAKGFFCSIGSSKSEMIRALTIRTFEPQIEIKGRSEAEDVIHAKSSYENFANGLQEFYVGDSAALLRFLSFRVSRLPGKYSIKMSEALAKRPHEEIASVLSQLGVIVVNEGPCLVITSKGWQLKSTELEVQTDSSSQFLSGLILSAVDLPFDLRIKPRGRKVSESYLNMSVSMLRDLGLQIEVSSTEIFIKANQKIEKFSLSCDLDWSSLFTLSSYAVLGGELKASLPVPLSRVSHADRVFIEIFKKARIPILIDDDQLSLNPCAEFLGVEHDFLNSPDLVPVLSCLMVFAGTNSRFKGVHHLRFKESDRLSRTIELIKMAGGDARLELEQGEEVLCIEGKGKSFIPNFFEFDPRPDHRMWMASQIFTFFNSQIKILHPEVCKKSFPELLELLGESL